LVALLFIVIGNVKVVQAQPSKKEIEAYVYSLGFKYPDIILKQIQIESNYGKSNIGMNNKNLLGMKLATRRQTLAIGKRSGYAVFRNWKDSVKDRLLLDKYNKWDKLDRNTYLLKMRTVYCNNCGKGYLF